MATGGESSPKSKKPSIVTRSATGASKPVDYQQMVSGKYKGTATLDEYGYEESGESQSDTGLYQDNSAGAFIRPEVDPFMGNPRKSSLSFPREDFDYQLAAEEEELSILRRQLEAAQKEQELLKKRGEADELRRQLAEQQIRSVFLKNIPKHI